MSQAVQEHRGDDHHADDDFLKIRGPTHLLGAIAQDRHDQRTDHRAQHGADAAAQARAADDHRGNDIQLQADRHGGIALPQSRELHQARQAEKPAGDHVDQDLCPHRRNALEPIATKETDSLAAEALAERTFDLVEQRLRMATRLPAALLQPLVPCTNPEGSVEVDDCMKALRSIEQHGARADLIASLLLADGEQRQLILESLDVEERLRNLNRFLSAEVLRARKNAPQ